MTVRYGRRLENLPPSGTLQVGRKVASLRAQGINIINFGGGLPDPQPPCLAAPTVFPAQLNVVGSPAGELELRKAIASKLEAGTGVSYEPEHEIVVTIGAKQGIFASLFALIEPGDEVIVFDPSWVTYQPVVELADGKPAIASLRHGDTFLLDTGSLEAAITLRTRAIILNSPHNPTGRVFSTEEIEAVAQVARNHNLWILSDESFDKFVFDDNQHISVSQMPGMQERTVVLGSFSKAYALPGCRVGYLAAPQPLCEAITRLNEQIISCVSPLAQHVALQALAFEPDWTRTLKVHYQHKRDIAYEMLTANANLTGELPQGTFYLLVNIEKLGKSSEEVANYLLHKAHVAVTPGSAFGVQGEGFVRLNLVGSEDNLRVGLKRMLEAI
jgi:aspartate/methionine/tyrosine aminotransferase